MDEQLMEAMLALLKAASENDEQEVMRILQQHPELMALFAEQMQADESPLMPIFRQAQAAEQRYLQHSDVTGLDDAVHYWQQILQHAEFAQQSNEFQIEVLNNSAVTFMYRYGAKGQLQDLDIALQTWQHLLTQLPAGSPYIPIVLNGLGNGLTDRHTRFGQLSDLEEGIKAYQQAIDNMSQDSPELASSVFNNLGVGLTDRYRRLGQLSDLEASIKAYRQSIDKTPQDSPVLGRRLSNLGTGLADRYRRLGQLSDLEEGIQFYQRAINNTLPDSPELAGIFNNLGTGLRARYLHLEQLSDLEKSIQAYQQAINNTPKDSPAFATMLKNLGTGLRNRYNHLGQLSDLEESIQAYQQAIRNTPQDLPELPQHLNSLGNGLMMRYYHSGDASDLQQGIEAFKKAIALGQTGSLAELLRSATNWLNWAFKRNSWAEMEEAYITIQTASKQLVEQQLLREHQEAFLTDTQGLAVKVAYARIQTDDLAGAVEVLEQGVARLLTAALAQDHADVSQLQHEHPDLYHAYEQQRVALQNAKRFYQNANDRQREQALTDWQQQQQAFDDVLTRIRQQDGYSDFLQIATDCNRVYQAAQTTRLVYLFSTAKGGYALSIWQQEIQAIALPELVLETLAEQGNQYFDFYYQFLAAIRNQTEITENFNAWLKAIDTLSTWLGQTVMQPLMQALPDCAELTLIPIGALNLFPLHLACWTDTQQKHHYALDHITFNYSPNALALLNAQQRANLPRQTLLSINEPLPVKANRLPSSDMETAAIQRHFSDNTRFAHENATVNTVKNALNTEPHILHFSCHGGANMDEPLQTGLLMANNETLTVADFLQADLNARLISLSACETGLIGNKQFEEVVGLPSSLLQAGAAGVIASLWSVNDKSTAFLMIRFYDNFMRQHQPPALALKNAQHWLRDLTYAELKQWLDESEIALDFVHKNHYQTLANNSPNEKPYQASYFWGAFYCTGV